MINNTDIKNGIVHLWDRLAERFDTHKYWHGIHPDAAVNMYVGWPIFLQLVEHQASFLGKRSCAIFDFGCGTGSFCKELHNKYHHPIGMDISKAMLEKARKNLPKKIRLLHGNHYSEIFESPEHMEKYDIVTAIHSLEWIKDVKIALSNLSKLLSPRGLILFATFPKKHVIDSLAIKDLFENFDSTKDPYFGYANFDGIKVPVYVRDVKFFDKFFEKLNFEKVLEYYPQYPKNFFEKYKWTGSKYPEMMILAYRKI